MFKTRFLNLIRGSTVGKIETAEVCGQLIKVEGWTSREDTKIQIKFKNKKSTIFPILKKPSSRADLEVLGFAGYEFSSTLCIANSPIQKAKVSFVPKIRFQKRVNLKELESINSQQLLSKFGLQVLVENRSALPKIDINNLTQIVQENLFNRVCEIIIQKGLEESTLLILLQPSDSNIIHSQLLLLEMSRVTEEKFLVLILTESEMQNVLQFSWSQLLRNNDVALGFLEKANPSELLMAVKQSHPGLKVAIIRQGQILTSLSEFLAELNSNHDFSTEESTSLKTSGSSARDIGAGIVIGNSIPKFPFPRAPLHDWDYIEFSRTISSFKIFETNLLIGKQSFTFESINNEITKQMEGRL
jgi:hypothetical protein